MTASSLLSAHDLCVGFKPTATIAGPVSFELEPGEILFLLGRNGAGKTTLLRTLAGLLAPLQGRVLLGGERIEGFTPHERARRRAMSFATTPLGGPLRVREAVTLGRLPYADWAGKMSSKDEEAVDRVLKRTGCDAWQDRWLDELSDGQRQRVHLARTLAQETPVVLLDEPTAFIDLPQRVEMARLLKDWTREGSRGVIVSTHDLDLALATADRIGLLGSDGLLTLGIPEELVMSGAISRVFESNDVAVDPSTGRLVWCLPGRREVQVAGTGLWAEWTKRALMRAGYQVVQQRGDLLVEVAEHAAKPKWKVSSAESVETVESLGALLGVLDGQFPA